jgi:hypothetical protein
LKTAQFWLQVLKGVRPGGAKAASLAPIAGRGTSAGLERVFLGYYLLVLVFLLAALLDVSVLLDELPLPVSLVEIDPIENSIPY